MDSPGLARPRNTLFPLSANAPRDVAANRPALRSRPLFAWETPEPGDLYFETGHQLLSRIIRLGTASRTNHVGVIIEANATTWTVVEAVADGVVIHDRTPPVGTVIRVSHDPDVSFDVASVAIRQALTGVRYDWWTIARHALRAIARVPAPITLCASLLFGVPALAALAAASAAQILHRPLGWLALRTPLPNNPKRMICSEQTTRCLREVFGEGAILPGRPAHLISPGDLLHALLGRRNWRNSGFPEGWR